MGLTGPSEYTAPMTREFPPVYQCGDLRISPSFGTISNASGASVRLGPVNMKVLEVLLARAGDVVSRRDLFDTVWKNQVVSEDALTRCISDIRAELRAFTGRDDWIETLPKRGYRWLGELREVDAVEPNRAPPRPDPPEVGTAPRSPIERLARLGLRAALYLGALTVMAMGLAWLVGQSAGERMVVVAILPATASAELAEQATGFDLAMTEYLMQIEGVRVLSPSAIDSRPANPFPFFAYEFNARWLIETDLREMSGMVTIVVTVADARTGISEIQVSDRLADSGDESAAALAVFESLSKFITSDF